MTIPEKVLLGGIPYAVERVDKNALGLRPKDAASIYPGEQIIYLDDSGPDVTKVNFLHECVHGMLFGLGLQDHDEKLVDGLAHQLYMFIEQNPEMFKT